MDGSDTTGLYQDYLGHPVILIGAGGISSHALSLLMRTGTRSLAVYDADVVAPVNLQAQNFDASDVGQSKAEVLAKKAAMIHPGAKSQAFVRYFVPEDALDGLVVSGVDSMQSRSMIFESVCRHKNHIPLFLDGRLHRVNPDWAELYAIDPQNEWEVAAYRGWLFDDKEVPRTPRPDSLAVHAPYALVALMGSLLARWVKDRRHPWKVTFDAAAWHTESYYAPAQQTEERS